MAEIEFSHGMGAYSGSESVAEAEAETQNSLKTWTNAAGALVSLALIGGIGVWGYELAVRDVSGIPVVRAATNDMRVRPEDPGGQLARHQGLAVNEIAARGAASGPVDRVVLAPPAVALAAEDQPVATRTAPILQPAPLVSADAAFDASLIAGSTPAPVESLSDRLQKGAIDDVVAELMADTPDAQRASGAKVVPARQVEADAVVTPAAFTEPQPALLLDAPGLKRSARPRLRPANADTLIQQASFTPPAATQEIDPDAIPAGTRLAQLGAYDSPEVARAEWQRMETRFGEILSGKSRVVQKAQSNGKTFYRLRAMGFIDLSDARRFCSAVKAEGVDCIPVQVK